MDCPECAEMFEEPKRLKCGHTVCLKCAQSRVDTAVRVKKVPILQCPVVECLKHTPVPSGMAASLPTNLLWKKAQDVYEKYPASKSLEMNCKFCNESTNMEDMRNCQNCHKYICVWCEPRHTESDIFKNHQIENTIKICCNEHHRICEYLCEKCDHFICMLCVHNKTDCCSNHSDHIKDMELVKEEIIKKIQEYQDKMKEHLNIIDKNSNCDLDYIYKMIDHANHIIKSEVHQQVMMLCKQMPDLVDVIKTRQKEMMIEIEEWKKPLENREERLMAIVAGVRPLVEELIRCAEEGMKGGTELKVITSLLFKSSFPSALMGYPRTLMDTDIRFEPEESIHVGHLYINSKSIDLTIKPCLKWQKAGLKWGNDVLFTPRSHIVVCDGDGCNVLIYDDEGVLITTSRERGVTFAGEPWGVTYDEQELNIIVGDLAGELSWLCEPDLNLRKRIKLEGLGPARGVDVLSDGKLAICRGGDPHTVGIYDREGRKLMEVTHYGHSNQYSVLGPGYIRVLHDDTIVVAMCKNKHVVYLSPKLQCWHIVDVSWPRGLSVTPEEHILVAGVQKDCIHLLRGQMGGSIQPEVIMKFSEKDIKETGAIQSVAMMGNQLAVVFVNALQIYRWT